MEMSSITFRIIFQAQVTNAIAFDNFRRFEVVI